MNLYVHFPFCRAKCAYCALYSRAGSTPEARRTYCARLAAELATWGTDPEKVGTVPTLSTIYFGGGSPALCDLSPLFAALRKWGTDPEMLGTDPEMLGTDPENRGTVPEFTVELHPLDARPEVLEMLKKGGVNRVSMGVQSLDDDVLKAMGRLHTAAEAAAAFRAVRAAGFTNAGIDLIAGWPGTTPDSWRSTLARATALGLDHCSVYTLIREPKTRLDLALRRGELALPSDDAALAQIDAARAALAEAGLVRYEISNYARPGFESRHNSGYWARTPYLGFGPGAHSFDGNRCRSWNTPDIDAYLRTRPGGQERLSDTEVLEEKLMLALRTVRGLDLDSLTPAERAGLKQTTLEELSRVGKLIVDAGRIRIPAAELFVSDDIICRLIPASACTA